MKWVSPADETPNFAVYGHGINDSGQLVGCSPTFWGDIHAFRWTLTEGMVDLGELDGDWHVFD